MDRGGPKEAIAKILMEASARGVSKDAIAKILVEASDQWWGGDAILKKASEIFLGDPENAAEIRSKEDRNGTMGHLLRVATAWRWLSATMAAFSDDWKNEVIQTLLREWANSERSPAELADFKAWADQRIQILGDQKNNDRLELLRRLAHETEASGAATLAELTDQKIYALVASAYWIGAATQFTPGMAAFIKSKDRSGLGKKRAADNRQLMKAWHDYASKRQAEIEAVNPRQSAETLATNMLRSWKCKERQLTQRTLVEFIRKERNLKKTAAAAAHSVYD